MQKLENQINGGTHSLDASDLHDAMVIIEHGDESLLDAVDISVQTVKKLSNIISAYLLMDVLYTLNLPALAQNLRYTQLPRSGLVPPDKVSNEFIRLFFISHLLALATGRLGSYTTGRVEQFEQVGKVQNNGEFITLLCNSLH
jgi:hypothetical protein